MGIQQDALRALSKVLEACPVNAGHVGHQGMRAVLAAMATYLQHEHIQELALLCLCEMTTAVKPMRRLLIEDNGLCNIVRSMHTHKNADMVQRQAITLITFLSGQDDIDMNRAILQAGCIAAVTDALLTRTQTLEKDQDIALRGT
jgi:hypothetical protein